MTEFSKGRFADICRRDAEREPPASYGGIGTYREKRLHRILKSFACEDTSTHEIPVGSYIADVLTEGHIYEIQTGSFRLLRKKLEYYLNETDLQVTVIYPIIARKTIIRMDKETGEVLRKRLSPTKGRVEDILPELYWVSDIFDSPRLSFCAMLIDAEEIRFSERIKYRKSGAYDSELFPKELADHLFICGTDSLSGFIPENTECFSAKEYSAFTGLKGRAVYSALNFFCACGRLERRKDGKRYLYYT